MKSDTTQARAILTRHVCATLALLVTVATNLPEASAAIAFSDVSASAGVNHAGESYGASWGDLDGDGYLDIFASNHRTQPSLFLNRRNGKFYNTAPQVLIWRNRSRADTHGGTWADFDNDGDQDLLVSTGTGNLSQLLVNENTRLVDRAEERGLTTDNVGGRLPIWLDYDNDKLPDFVMTQYGGIARVFRQGPVGRFTETTADVKLVCKRFHYGHLYETSANGRLDLLCADETVFPQKIYNTLPTPWQKLFDSAAPTNFFPAAEGVVDSVVADFDNNGEMDMFLLSNVQLRPASVVQSGSNYLEAQLTGGTKGFKFVTSGKVTFTPDWNRADEQSKTELKKIEIGANGKPAPSLKFTLDPADTTNWGMPPAPTTQEELPLMQIGYDKTAQRWTVVVQTKLLPSSPNKFSEAYLRVSSSAAISGVLTTGFWPGDLAGRPTLLSKFSGGYADGTVAAGLDAPLQCVSATAGDYDNDMDVDLYLACRTGASNTANILYENVGGTFHAVASAGGAVGPVGIAVKSGAGTADSVISGDYDVDGFLDLFVTNGFNLRPLNFGGPNKLFHNKGNSNNWVEFDLVGKNSDRDAVGARVYVTANGKTQLRVQNGGYHRWSQDAVRSHFGLAGASSANVVVNWPSGAQTVATVAANKLYRITEGTGVAAVNVGAAKAVYPCGPPTINASNDIGVFIWRDCPSGEWRLKTAAGGGTVNFSARIGASVAYSSVKPVTLEASDSLNFTTDPKKIVFQFSTVGSNSDGVNFLAPDHTSICLKVDAPAGAKVFFGPFRTQIAQPFNLETQKTCSL